MVCLSKYMATEQNPLKELSKLFLKLGCLGFGGPAVHIAAIFQTKQTTLDLVLQMGRCPL